MGPIVFEQDWYIWNLEWMKGMKWRGSSMFLFSQFIDNKDIFQHIRNLRWDEVDENKEFIKQKNIISNKTTLSTFEKVQNFVGFDDI